MDNIELEIQNESVETDLETQVIEVNLNGGTRGLKGDTGDKGETGEKGDPGEKGEKGDSGVWVGEETPPEDYDVWIDPDGTPSTIPTKLSDLEDDSTHRLVTDTDKSNLNSNTAARHTHSNKSVLDGISSTDVSNWNTNTTNIGTLSNLTTTAKTNLVSAINEINSKLVDGDEVNY